MKVCKTLILCLAALTLCQTNVFALRKSDRLKPQWVTKAVPDSPGNNYIFVRSFGRGTTVEGAKQAAFVDMSLRLEIERGLTVSTAVESKEVLSRSESGTEASYRQEITMEVEENGRKLNIVCREIDDYWELRGAIYEVYVLYAVTNKDARRGSHADDIKVTTDYGLMGGLRSIIPGVGQFYKGSTLKGSMILGGEMAAAGGILICEVTRASYIKKMHEQPKYAAQYNSLADSWENGRNVCIGAAAAIYIYNLIDAFTAKGAKHIVIDKGRANLSVSPYTDGRSAGVGMSLNF